MRSTCIQYVILIGVFLLGSSCAEKQEYEVISIDEMLPQTEREYAYDQEEKVDQITYSALQQKLSNLLPEINFDENNILAGNIPLLLPNRLGYEDKNEVYFQLDHTPFYLIQWDFSDSARTINAFYNWIDCFGSDCHSMKINEEKKLDQNAFAIWVHEHSITYLTSPSNFSLNNWEDILFKNEDHTLYFLLQQNARDRTRWIQRN